MQYKKKAIIEQDLILIYVEEKPAFFARVEKILPDVKKHWWRVSMLALQIPVKVITWILDDEQIRGADFTMRGIPIRIEKVEVSQEGLKAATEVEPGPTIEESGIEKANHIKETEAPEKQARILSFASKRKNSE